jgi:hypothetical protein
MLNLPCDPPLDVLADIAAFNRHRLRSSSIFIIVFTNELSTGLWKPAGPLETLSP